MFMFQDTIFTPFAPAGPSAGPAGLSSASATASMPTTAGAPGPWQEHYARSGLLEVLHFASQLQSSELFDKGELAAIRGELQQIARSLALNLVSQLRAVQPTTPAAATAGAKELPSQRVQMALDRLAELLSGKEMNKP